MSLLGDIGHAITSVPKTVSSAVTGRRGVFGGKGVVGNLMRGKFLAAVQAGGHAVGQVVDNHAIQSAFPNIAVPVSVLAGATKGGPRGALNAVGNAAKNPIIKAELAALAVVLPPLAPASASGIAAMEATSRMVDAMKSGDPKRVAAAAMGVGATMLAAKQGDAGAQRALQLMRDTQKARDIATGKMPTHVLRGIQDRAKSGDKKAKAALVLVQHQAIREAHKAVTTAKRPAMRVKAGKRLAAAQKAAPGIMAATMAALNTPKGVRVGDFALLRTGRILHKGQPIRRRGGVQKPPLRTKAK